MVGKTNSSGPLGIFFTPNVDTDGNLSWSNNAELDNPPERNIKGPKGDPGRDGTDLGAYVTPTASGAIASFDDGAEDLPVKSLVVDIEPVQAGSGAASPSNVRPISGWTGVKVQRAGNNLITSSYWDTTAIAIYVNALSIEIEGDLAPSTEYTLSFEAPSGYRYYLNENLFEYNFIETTENRTIVHCKTISSIDKSSNTQYKPGLGWTILKNHQNQPGNNNFTNLQLELGSTATAYEPYQGDTYNIDFPAEAGTVYGGTLDVTNGVLTVDRAKIQLNSLSYTKEESSATNARFRSSIAGMKAPTDNYTTVNAICATYPAGPWSWIDEPGHDIFFAARQWANVMHFIVRNAAYATTPEFVASLSDADVLVYELATPVTYQLTPTEVDTLLGVNNIHADTGAVSVTYRADPTLIYNKLTAAIISSGGIV